MTELLLCPFCGSTDLDFDEDTVDYVTCNNCNAAGPDIKPMTNELAKSRWNTRVDTCGWYQDGTCRREEAIEYATESTCTVESLCYDGNTDSWCTKLSCGHEINEQIEYINYCIECGAKVQTCKRIFHDSTGKWKYQGWYCSACGKELPPAVKSCLWCKAKVVDE